MPYHPTSVNVARAWLSTLPGITSGMVATTLPKDTSAWQATGFITLTVAGGGMDPDTPLRNPLIQADYWACSPNSGRPPWELAHQLAETTIAARLQNGRRDVLVRSGFWQARVQQMWPVLEPQPLYDDASSFARVRVDWRLTWAELAMT